MLPSSQAIRSFLAEAYVATDRLRRARGLLLSSAATHGAGEVDQSIDERIDVIRKRRMMEAERAAGGARGLEQESEPG